MVDRVLSRIDTLVELIRRRGLEMTTDLPDRAGISTPLVHRGYFQVDARGPHMSTIFVLVDPHSLAASSTPAFASMMSAVVGRGGRLEPPAGEIIMFVDQKFLKSSHLMQATRSNVSLQESGIHLTLLHMDVISTVVPDHVLTPTYTIVDAATVATELGREIEHLSQIYNTDAGAVWVGAKVGDVLRAEYSAEGAALTGTAYRRVIAGGPIM